MAETRAHREFRPFGVFRESPALHLYLVQFVGFLYVAWRFASRNYTVYAHLRDDQFEYARSFVLELWPLPLLELTTFQFIYDLGIPRPTEGVFTALQITVVAACLGGLIGLAPRLAARVAFLFALHISGFMQTSNSELDGGTIALCTLLVLSVTPRGALYSWTSGFHPLRRSTAHHWPIFLLFLFVGAYYTASGLNKIFDVGPHWPLVLRIDRLATTGIEESLFAWSRHVDPFVASLHTSPLLSAVAGVIALIGEAGFITILFLPRFRLFFAASMITMHVLVFEMAGINFLGSSLIILLCLDWNAVARRARVYYDDRCGMCTASVRRLRRIDWFRRLEYVPTSAVGAADRVHREHVQGMMAAEDENGEVYYGADALEQIGARCWVLLPYTLLMKVPGLIYPARAIYGAIARRRHAISCRLGLRPDETGNEPS